MRDHGKMMWPLALLAIAAASPIAAAQDAAQAKTKVSAPAKPGGAVSSSYAACAPGNPIGGIIVKGGQNPKGPKGRAVDACPDQAADGNSSEHGDRREIAPVQPEAAAREGTRTYTGGRRNEEAPAAAEAAPGQPIKGVIVKGGGPNKPAQAGQAPPTGTAKSISEKGVSSTKSR